MTQRLVQFARKLRRNSTDAERKLWNRLRRKNMLGLKFHRQEPIGPYIVDFICFEKRIVIEVDGGQHASQKTKDTVRDQWLEGRGFTVVRFWDNDVLKNTDGVLDVILEN